MQNLLYRVTSSPCYVAHYRSFFLQKCVQQSRFPCVRFSDYRHIDAVFHCISILKTINKTTQLGFKISDKPHQCRAVSKFNIFFSKIKFQFDKRSKIQQIASQHGYFLRNSAFQLLKGSLSRSLILGSNKVSDGFRLREVYTPVHKGSHSKFPCFCGSRAVSQQSFQDFFGNVRRTMKRNFHRIFRRKSPRRMEHRDHHLIYYLFAIFHKAIMHRVSRHFFQVFPFKNSIDHRQSILPRNADNAYCSHPIGSCKGAYRILIHNGKDTIYLAKNTSR